MATKTIGKLDSWEDADIGGNDFMDLKEGPNPVRVITSPYQFYVVWTFDAADQKRKVKSTGDGATCPLVKRGEEAKPRWYVGVLDRNNKDKPSILEVGPQIFRQILSLSKNKKWGDPKNYDINIHRQPKGSQPLYVVQPDPPTELTDSEKSAIEGFVHRVDFSKLTEVPSSEEVLEMLGLPSSSKEAPSTSSVDNDFESAETDDDIDFDDEDF